MESSTATDADGIAEKKLRGTPALDTMRVERGHVHTDRMQPGHVSLPNGLGVDVTDEHGTYHKPGVSPNDLTSLHHRDWLVSTPWHKHVAARLEAIR